MLLKKDGFQLLKKVISEPTISYLIDDLSKIQLSEKKSHKSLYGVRNLLNLSPKIHEFAESETVRNITDQYLRKNAQIVRAIFFDKTDDANWKVPWHQDLTISVCGKIETKGFTAWTQKAGIHHVQPPIEILEKMLSLRFHLDDADETNGALKVLAGTHKFGRLSATEIQNHKSKQTVSLRKAEKGDCLLMKPLLIHSSSAGSNPKHRRVIHLEFSSESLPNGLQFYGS